jgi:uncharacterized protein (UPF0261 family)
LDTKAAEYGFCRDRLLDAGLGAVLIDTGILDRPGIVPDVSRDQVAAAAGTVVTALSEGGDRNHAMVTMASGAAALLERAVAVGEIDALFVIGGSNAGYLMSRIAPTAPIGVPKMLVSTIVAGDTRPYVGGSDLTMMYPVVDIAGLNSISRTVLIRATDAVIGMLRAPTEATSEIEGGPAIGCSMFGVTTGCVDAVRAAMVGQGREVHVFHATGVGGRGLESMIRSGLFAAVADITTTELADDLVGGVCSAGPDRLTAAAGTGTPQVVSVGALDMVNFGPPETIPERFRGRLLFPHNPSVTLMRTNAEENAELGRRIAVKLNAATAPTELHIPLRGFSQISAPGGVFHDPEADRALIDTVRRELRPGIALFLHDLELNDPDFAENVSSALDRVLAAAAPGSGRAPSKGNL